MAAMLEQVSEFLSLTEAGARFQKHPATIARWVRSGRLKGIQTKIGLLVDPVDVERLVRELKADSKGDQ